MAFNASSLNANTQGNLACRLPIPLRNSGLGEVELRNFKDVQCLLYKL